MAEEEPLEASVQVQAPPEAVWRLVTDITRMGEWSPQCRGGRWIGGRRGPVVGARFLGFNRQGWVWWATTNKVVEVEPERVFAFRNELGRVRWVFRLDTDGAASTGTGSTDAAVSGTTLVQRRELPTGRSALSSVFIGLLLGGNRKFDSQMQAGMRQTLERIKAAAERG